MEPTARERKEDCFEVRCAACGGRGHIKYRKPQALSSTRWPMPSSTLEIEERDCELCDGLGYRNMTV